MKRLERLTALVSYLQSRRYTPISELTNRFEVSERTVFRDLKALESSGVPIAFEPGYGYSIAGGHFLPPLGLTLDEAKSLIFLEQLAFKYTDSETADHFASVVEKIRNKLNESQLEEVEGLQSRVVAFIDPAYTPQYLSRVERACTEQHVLDLDYEDARGNRTHRLVEPIGITFYSQSWHLIAWCHLREDYRDFSMARIRDLRESQEPFSRTHLTLTEYLIQLEAANAESR